VVRRLLDPRLQRRVHLLEPSPRVGERPGEYVAAQPAPARAALERVRAILRKALHGATEGISYQIPVYKLDGVMVLYFAGFRRHYSVYPASAGVVAALGHELEGRLHSKATIRFSYDDPVPARLIARIAKLRAAEVAERKTAKAASGAARKAKAARGRDVARRRGSSGRTGSGSE
jgi:uncharacterized protein YdhG (YjbR/CyaY superfamily)